MHPTYHHNYHFTFEMTANFVYKRGAGQVFTFAGDDDVWVFVDGKLVIDVGGVHGPISQTVDLDRVEGLVDGQSYPLKFFFAERHTTGSNCRIETSLNLVPAQLPATSALYD
jgi:fibro-slime domain-containing protein